MQRLGCCFSHLCVCTPYVYEVGNYVSSHSQRQDAARYTEYIAGLVTISTTQRSVIGYDSRIPGQGLARYEVARFLPILLRRGAMFDFSPREISR